MQPKPDPQRQGLSETWYRPECGRRVEQWIREQLQLGIDAIARGEIHPFDPAAIKAAGRRRIGPPTKPRRWLRYSLRTLLVTVTLACVWLGMVVNRAEQQRRTVAALRALGNQVEYDTPYTHPLGEPSNWRWLRSWIGNDYFDNVTYASLRHGVDDKLLQRVRYLRGVKHLDINGPVVTDEGMAAIAGVASLESLSIYTRDVTDEGVRALSTMRNLQGVLLRAPKVTDRGLRCLSQMTWLESLHLVDAKVTDDGLVLLDKLSSLETLGIEQEHIREPAAPHVTDRGMQIVARMPNLQRLYIHSDCITDEGLAQLAPMRGLRDLHIQCNRPLYTEEGVEALQSKLPMLSVTHSAWSPMRGQAVGRLVFNSPPKHRK